MLLFYNMNYNCKNDVAKIPAKHMKLQCNAILVMIYAEFVLFWIIHCSFKEFWVSFTSLLRGLIHNIIRDNKCLHRLAYCIFNLGSQLFISYTYIKKDYLLRILKILFNMYMTFSINNWRRIIYHLSLRACMLKWWIFNIWQR